MTSGVLRGWYWDLCCYISAGDMDSGTEGTLSKLTADTELCGAGSCWRGGVGHPQGPKEVELCPN